MSEQVKVLTCCAVYGPVAIALRPPGSFLFFYRVLGNTSRSPSVPVHPYLTGLIIMSDEVRAEKDMCSYFAEKFSSLTGWSPRFERTRAGPFASRTDAVRHLLGLSRNQSPCRVVSWDRDLQIDLQLAILGAPILGWLALFVWSGNRHWQGLIREAYCLVLHPS